MAIIGPKDTFKTRVAELLISRLSSMGFRVAGVKHLHASRIDRPGKDTWRMAEAGAHVVLAVGNGELAVIERRNVGLEEALKTVEGEVDVAVVEGFKEEAGCMDSAVKVLTAKDIADLEGVEGRVKPPVAAITGPVAKKTTSWRGMPVVDLDSESDRLVDLVVNHLSSLARGRRETYQTNCCEA